MPLRPWMKFALAALGTINVLLGVAMVGFYHEGCKLLGLPKPHPLWPLQAAGAITLLLGIGYWLASRQPIRFKGVLIGGFIVHVVASLWIVWIVSQGKLKLEFLVVVLLTALCYLVPLALVLRRLSSAKQSVTEKAVWPKLARRAIFALMMLAIMLPSSWAVAHAAREINVRRELRDRPGKWTPLAANLPKSVGEEFPYTMAEPWPHLRFVDPTYVGEIPDGSGRMIVQERRGLVRAFSKQSQSGDDPAVLLDITDRALIVPEKAEDGLLGFAFHPEYANEKSPHRGEVFVRYTSMAGGQRSNRLSRFKLAAGASTIDRNTEEILIELPEKSLVHKGGAVTFGPDGFLYTTFGTDGRHFPHEHVQRIDHGLWAGVLRIDVDCRGGDVSHAPPRAPAVGKATGYFIPNDSPFVGQHGVLEEFFSLGLRNPWRMSIDPQTGLVWLGDVGDRRREEVNVSTPGANHQFDYMEGTLPTRDYQPRAPTKPEKIIGHEAPPLFEYERDGTNRCVIGGYVYRGKKFPELVGKYVYGDQCGRLCAITVDDDNKFVRNEMIAIVRADGLGVSSLGEDADGELYVCWIGNTGIDRGQIFRFERSVERPEQKLPQTLSATGLFTDLKSLTPNPALIDFDVNSPLWSDRAEKQRWIGLASHEKIGGELNGRWKFPAGTVFVKHFDLPLDERVQGSGFRVQEATVSGAANGPPAHPTNRRLETRVLVCGPEGAVYGAAYRWNKEETEAYLVSFTENEDIEYVDAGGETRTQTWTYPGRLDCLACHNQVSGGVLGFTARQLNRDLRRHGLRENQLVKFAQAGMFKFDCRPEDAPRVTTLARLDDRSASVEYRLRSYLDANCSHCHQPGGRFGPWDARITTPLGRQGIIDGVAVTHRGEDPRSRVVRPGNLGYSFMHVRLSSNDHFLRMPPLARDVVHNDAVKLLTKWISTLPPLPEDADKPSPMLEVNEETEYLTSQPRESKTQ